MTAQILPFELPRKQMALIAIMTGSLDCNGELDERAVQKLVRAKAAADEFHRQNPPQPYSYVFLDCTRLSDNRQRVCDMFRIKAVEIDPYCRAIEVPPADAEFVSDDDRLNYLNAVRTKVVGDCVILA